MIIRPVTFAQSAGGGGLVIPAPVSQWLFNAGSGSTVTDEKSAVDLNITDAGGVAWGSGYLSMNQDANTSYFAAANNTHYNLNDYTIINWIQPNALANTINIFFVIGDGVNVSPSNFSIALLYSTDVGTSKWRAFLSSGSGLSYVDLWTPSLAAGTKYCFVVRYTRTGGALNNILKLDVASSGSTFTSSSNTGAVLMQQNSGFKIRSNSDTTNDVGANCRWYRTEIYNSVLSDDALNVKLAAGSE